MEKKEEKIFSEICFKLREQFKKTHEQFVELAKFDLPVQQKEFEKKLKDFSGIFVSVDQDSAHLLVGPHFLPFASILAIENYLAGHGPTQKCLKVAEIIQEELKKVLTFVQRIRRNILYPEVAEMEKEIERLKINLITWESRSILYEKMLKDERYFKSKIEEQLAEKEKELFHLENENKRYKEREDIIAGDTYVWVDELNKIISDLDQTKKIFKSKTIAKIREKIEILVADMRKKLRYFMNIPDPPQLAERSPHGN